MSQMRSKVEALEDYYQRFRRQDDIVSLIAERSKAEAAVADAKQMVEKKRVLCVKVRIVTRT